MKLPYAAPDKNLTRELRQVRLSANAVTSAMAEANFLPTDFPSEVLKDLCSSLAGLEQGTAENSRPTLEYARNKIPQIRREFFYLEEEDAELSEQAIAEPRLYRGMAFDRHLNTLIGSVATALDEYRAQAQARFDDEVRAEEVIILRSPHETEEPTSSASDVIETADRAYFELRSKKVDQTANGEILARRLKDSSNLALAARSQILGGKIVRRWFEGITNAILALPQLISQAGGALKVGADIADVLADWWSETEHALVRCSIDQVRRFGVALEGIGDILKRREAFPMKADPQENRRNPMELEAEAEVDLLLRSGKEVPSNLARLVRHLRINGSPSELTEIKRWQDIARCDNLISLIAYHTDFAIGRHLSYLFGLRQLRELRLPTQEIYDITALGQLCDLTTLSLPALQVVDISPIRRLTALTNLSLHVPKTGDVSALEGLTRLTYLNLTANQTRELSALRNLSQLTSLRLMVNEVRDISGLEKLTNLLDLSLHSGDLKDISALGKLTRLTRLILYPTYLDDISELGKLVSLTLLSLTANEVENISALGNLINLATLRLVARKVRDISVLSNLVSLTSLFLESHETNDISALAQLRNLKSLTIQGRKVHDISPLGELGDLELLNVQGNNILDISPLKGLSSLAELHLQINGVEDITVLSDLSWLNVLHLQANNANDIAALESLKGLRALSLSSRVFPETLASLFSLPRLARINLNLSNWDWLESISSESVVENLVLAGAGEIDLAILSRLTKLKTLQIGDIRTINRDALSGVDITILGAGEAAGP